MDAGFEHEPMEVRLFSREAVRALDRAAQSELAIPGILLMENAAFALEAASQRLMAERTLDRALILAGPGGNGGDGLALARRLSNRGVAVAVTLAFDPAQARGDAAINLTIAGRMGLPIAPAHPAGPWPSTDLAPEPRRTLVVDALLGTGADRPPEGVIARAIGAVQAMRNAGATVLAVDLPSGLDADTGRPLGLSCVRADLTVTLAGMKQGLLNECAHQWTGPVLVGDIGVPAALLRRFGSPMPRGD